MKKHLFSKLSFLLVFFTTFAAHAQLDPFTLTVTPTAQTCLGNGSLSFALSGTTAGSTIAYEVYLLPNTTTPVATVTSNTVNSLVAGNYLVIATQTLGPLSNTATFSVTIGNNVQPLTYTLTPRHVRCPGDGRITVNITWGMAVSYEIISGPVTFGPQATNVFNNLPVGQYQVRVIDVCGNAVVVTVQLTQVPTSVLVDAPEFGVVLPSCNTVLTDHFFATVANNEIFFPLTFEYTVFPPGGGAPIVVTQTVATGSNVNNDIYTAIPFYHDQQYSYNLKITDACGNVFTRNNNVVDLHFDFVLSPQNESCGNYYLKIEPSIFVAPYTVSFVSAPAGFNPANFNPAYPNHSGVQTFYGSDDNPVPLGHYEVMITDACGHSATQIIDLQDDATPVAASAIDPLTCLGQISITIGSRKAAEVIITAAPAAYSGTLPDDVSEFIDPNTGFQMGGLPLGSYTFHITDECGDEYTLIHEIVPSAEDLVLSEVQRAGCADGEGSVKLGTTTLNPLVTVMITAAPAGFGQPLPYNASFNVAADGYFYMNSLPAGTYMFETVDNCGTIRNKSVTIQGYQVTTNNVNIIANCGSFNIDLHHTSNGNYVQSFWLQKWNPVDNVWEHPGTGTDYPAGTLPTNANSVFLTNNNLNINLAYAGKFRILKVFHVFNNGSSSNYRCFDEVISTFTFDGAPVIDGAYSFPCSNNTSEVIIDAHGVPPLTYSITTKNGDPFVVNNGTSNLFTGLEPATYNFRVTDVCGSSQNLQLDINSLDPMQIGADGFCDGQDSSLFVTNFSFLTYEWFSDDDPTTILSTTNVLEFPAFDASDAGLYHVRITSPNPGSCINQVLDYEIVPGVLPNAGNNNNVSVCNDGTPVNLANLLSTPHDPGGTWADADASGALSGSMFNTAGVAQGTYHFTYTITGGCSDDVATITVQLKDVPVAPVITPVAAVCEGADVQLSAAAVTGGVYQWTGPGGFTSSDQNPLLSDVTLADNGVYSLIITVNGCPSPASTVTVTVNAVPNAGNDNNITECNDGQVVNLADYLSTPHTGGGTWADTSGSGALSGSSFNTAGVAQGTYQFTYTATGCGPDDSAVITIQLKDRPGAPVVAAVAPVCEGSDVQLSATAVPGATYTWSGPGGFTSSDQNPMLTGAMLADNGNYSLTVTVNGCASPASSVAVVVNPAPQFALEGNAAICEGQSTVVSIVPGNFNANDATYAWSKDGSLLNDVTGSSVEIFEPGVYDVTVNLNGCTANHEMEIIRNTNAFTVDLEAGCMDFNYMVTITNITEIPGATFDWSGPDGYSSSGESADITGLPAGEYTVTVTNADGCTAAGSVMVENTNCFIPRGISPNDDEYNQNFDLSNLDVRDLMIFNRYGLKVYEKEDYTDEWFGQSEQGDLPTGTYFYVATLSAGKQVTGWVYLQREIN